MMTSRIEASAPAKVNLALAVHGARPDGFHTITSLVQGVGLFDRLSFEPAEGTGRDFVCDDAALPTGAENLVLRAVDALFTRGLPRTGLHIRLGKRIPIAAGLGGGSSDAAATLVCLNAGGRLGLSVEDLAALGAAIASDVPLFFALPSAVVSGRGEVVSPVKLAWSGWVVLAFGGWEVSTRAVYAAYRAADHCGGSEGAIPAMIAARRAAELSPLLFNELEPAIHRTTSGVSTYQENLGRLAGLTWHLSGAGATAFALFDDEEEARRVGAAIRAENLGRGVAVVPTVTGSMEDFVRSEH